MKCLYVSAILSLLSLPVTAQLKKAVTYEQAFNNAPSGIFTTLPDFRNWADSNRLVITLNDKQSIVDIRAKTISPYTSIEKAKPLTKSKGLPKEINNYTLSPDLQSAAYTYQNNLYIINIATEEISQLTTDGNDSILNGYSSFLYNLEITGSNYKSFWWSKDSKHILFMRFDDSAVPLFPIYVATGQQGYVEKWRYPKAGEKNPKVKIGVVDVLKRKIVWADFNEEDDQYFRVPYFTPGGKLWVQWINRQQNNLKLYQVDMETGSKQEVYNESQATWVTQNDGVYFLPGNEYFINKSDQSGWTHFYLYDIKGKLINPITSGKFNVVSVMKYDPTVKIIYFTARKENSTRIDLYSIKTNGTDFKRITKGDYSYSNIFISPGTDYFVASYSNTSTPAAIALFDMKGDIAMKIDSVTGSEYQKYTLPKKELLRTKSNDGLYDLPFTITYPINFDKRKKYPVVMSVYGGPYSMNVNDSWNASLTETWWAQEGIIQIVADNRGSGHFGKEGMNYIYRKAGIFEIEDFMSVGKWLKQQNFVDTSKLCITGFSHGGLMTCLGLTYGADIFNFGIAFWPVTDWSLYDTYYTERYMGTPANNPEGYKLTSVFTYADRYKGLLRIVHGASDNNAHLQNSLQLIDTLQNLNKSFEFMIYPGQRHGLSGPKWKHNKMEVYRFYYKNLLNRNLPKYFLQK